EVIFHEAKARFDVAGGQYSFPCPAGSSKDEDKSIRKIDDVAIAMKEEFNE
ncbi:unnamed protein product, partial [Ectocarpus sp. 13 AM-2016]